MQKFAALKNLREQEFATMMLLHVKYTEFLLAGSEGGGNFIAMKMMADDECEEMFKQLSLINQKVNFFPLCSDYEFNLVSFGRWSRD